MQKKIKSDIDLRVFAEVNSKRITDLHAKCKTIKILDDDVGENLDDLGFGDDYFSYNTKM